MTRSEAIKKANEYYEKRRAEESLLLDRRENEIRTKYPEIESLLVTRANLLLTCARQAMAEPKSAKAYAEKMKNDGIAINARVRALLKQNGYSEDYLRLHYECAACEDTGYLKGSVPARVCPCFEKRLRQYMREDTMLNGQCFECFDAGRIPDTEVQPGLTQRAQAIQIRNYCEAYCRRYPDVSPRNFILSGQAGLGKTFLLNCIAQRMEENGHACAIISAYKLIEILRSKHFHEEESDAAFNDLASCPLLLIDDLGSEPYLRNISEEYLCMLLNERQVPGRYTILATNLTPVQISERYGERVMSRLCDKSYWTNFRLLGKDLRRV